MADTPLITVLSKAQQAAQRAIKAAESAIEKKIPMKVAAREFGAGPTSVVSASLVLLHGTAAEIASMRGGASLDAMASVVRQRVPKSERRPRGPTLGRETLEQRSMEADIWRTVSTGITGLTSLPDPKEVVKICRANGVRTKTVDDKLLIALKWLEEFSDEWTR